jgi:glycosyltransferase involved in cell wall biosynthesis
MGMEAGLIESGGEAAAHRAGALACAPLKVGALVDLTYAADAGGHVKCWERIAEAAVECGDQLDLTVHFNGPAPRRIELSPNVRYVLMPPVLSTRRFVSRVPDHTDLAPWHPRLARALADYDVIHTTDAFFCYARTATRFSRRYGVPVVSSIHTNTPEYARITVENMLGQMLGAGAAYRLASDSFDLPNRVSRLLERRLRRHLEQVTTAMAGYGDGVNGLTVNGHGGVSLRRGLDRDLFTPEKRDRPWFEARFDLPPGQFVVMYAGKLNAGKNVPLLMPAIETARQSGLPIHLFCAGAGDQKDALAARLGSALTVPGSLAQEELARVYASADLFAFPSMIDESGNAAVEAMACGLPALLAAGSGVATRMAGCPAARVLPGDALEAWAEAIVDLAARPEHCRKLGIAARRYVEAEVPSWLQVVTEDLLPVWQAAAQARWRG